ncbi:MAG: hypothetical protein AAGB51_05125 [Planctomycetota bacterium]
MSIAPAYEKGVRPLMLLAGGLLVLVAWRFASVSAGDMPPSPVPQALAEMVANRDGYSMMTSRVGNEEFLYVLDERAERLLIYRAGRNSIDLMGSRDLPRLFTDARTTAGRD